MKMKMGSLLILVAACLMIFASTAQAEDPQVPQWFIQDMTNNESVLEPGTTTYCDHNFQVQNMEDQTAQVQVILGNGSNYAFDMLAGGATQSYALQGGYDLAGGWSETKNVHIADARIVNSGDSKIKITCK